MDSQIPQFSNLQWEEFNSQERIIPIQTHLDKISADVFYLYQCWCKWAGTEEDRTAQPWLPIGNIGPLLLVAHYDPAAEGLPVPEWFCGRFVVSRDSYRSLLDEFERLKTDSLDVAFVKPERPWPSKQPNFQDDLAALTFLKYHAVMDPDTRTAAGVGFQSRASLADLPPGLRESVAFLRYRTPVAEMRLFRPAKELLELAPSTVNRYGCVPVYRSEKFILLATPYPPQDPTRQQCIDNFLAEARLAPRPKIVTILAPEDQITSLLMRTKSGEVQQNAVVQIVGQARKGDVELTTADTNRLDPNKIGTTDRQTVDWLLAQTILNESQDLHGDFAYGQGRFRINVDGHLRELLNVSEKRWMVCNMIFRDLARCTKSVFDCESKRFSVRFDGQYREFRLEATSCRDGTIPPSLTMRMMAREGGSRKTLEDLRFRPEYITQLRQFISLPHGLLLVTGATGSGKTTTLYSIINELNTPKRKIMTAEEPIESYVEGVLQSQVDEGRGITYDKLLRSFLRDAPNVIMIGEIRDRETAHKAVEAAGTGHFVLASLHTNTIAGAVARLVETFEVNPGVLSDVLIGGISQKLLHTLCRVCKRPQTDELLPKDIDLLTSRNLPVPPRRFVRNAGACPECTDGLRGRIAVLEFLDNQSAMQEAIRSGKTARELSKISHAAGAQSMAQECVNRLQDGLVDLQEIRPILLLDR